MGNFFWVKLKIKTKINRKQKLKMWHQ